MLSTLGCNNMFESEKKIKYIFKVDNDQTLLNVNLYLYKYDSGSKWYSIVKKKTVIEGGKVISPINDGDADYHKIEVYLPNIKKEILTDHIYIDSDYIFEFTFNSNGIDTLTKVNGGGHHIENKNFQSYQDINKNITHDFIHYNSIGINYELNNIKESLFDELKAMSFEDLKETDKILSKDIMKLNNLSFDQKKQLIEIHKLKKFSWE